MSFEDLRKQSRRIESDIDNKLVLFSKLASNYGKNNEASSKSADDDDTAPLLSGDQKYDNLCNELEALMNSLTDINDRMNVASGNSSSTVLHTLQRHRDILQDYKREFNRTKTTIMVRKEREQLMAGDRNDDFITGLSRRDLYLKESSHLVNSERMVDEQITIALETREHMKTQREAFKFIQTKVNDISNRFPMINSLVAKINVKKRKDALCLGAVIGACVTFMFWWFWA